jgi:hypothetical protein
VCIERLLKQIASRTPIAAPSQPQVFNPSDFGEDDEEIVLETAAEKRDRLSRAEIDDDEAFVAQRHAAREEYLRDGTEPVVSPQDNDDGKFSERPPPSESDLQKVMARTKASDCPHPNKTRPFLAADGKTMYKTCKDCGANIRMMTQAEKAAYTAGRVGDLDMSVGSNANISGVEEK